MNYSAVIFKFDWLNNALIKFFEYIHNLVHSIIPNPNLSYGLAIIIVTIIIRLLLFPLNYKQIRSTVKMNEIQPEMKKVQERYKNDPQRQQQEMMKLYKKHGVSPLGGCLPILLQWPILIALYAVFMNLPGIDGVKFLWINNLAASASMSDPATWILPVVSGATTYFSTVLMGTKSGNNAQAKQMGTMNIGMSIFITWMSFRFTSALVLYWVTNNLFQIGQTLLMKNMEAKKVLKEELE
ncbi:membrane protein insertase YidC [Clostridium ganghwense]|uniref:Membrane protein insertase YidC n=1 Tax=Clostridium ganghwense TaxID=312089 RepID=A0ABT4CUZ4_9CLOT|nr:membrane protein insertase YidC [Clostridium ganghwense]MCY6372268.1 membrane protein insertase YidC [Clostridium ganghwense]